MTYALHLSNRDTCMHVVVIITYRLNRSTERIYKLTNNERPVVSEQNPHTRTS